MPVRADREYRAMPLLAGGANEKKLNSDYYVEGYATTFNQPYELFEYGGVKYVEQIDARAFDEADLTDVLFLRNHEGKCHARTKMKQGKEPTLLLTVDPIGLHVAADLGTTEASRAEYNDIVSGLVYQMSFAFTVAEDEFNEDGDTILRTITKIKKVYDVSSVDIPANPSTEINARSAFEGVITRREQELFERRKRQKQKIRIMLEATK